MNSSVFLSVGKQKLYMDMIFVEMRHPILFTCRDTNNSMYIATCFHADAYEKEWLIARTTPEKIISLLTNKISIRDVFPVGNSIVYLAAKNKKITEPIVKMLQADQIPPNIFPTPGMFMDADEDEFKDEIFVLQKRVQLSAQHHTSFLLNGQAVMQFYRKVYTLTYSQRTKRDSEFQMSPCKSWRCIYEQV